MNVPRRWCWEETRPFRTDLPLEEAIDIRAEQFKFEIRIMAEQSLSGICPRHFLAARRARLNPDNHPGILI